MPGMELELEEPDPAPQEENRAAAVAARIASNVSFMVVGACVVCLFMLGKNLWINGRLSDWSGFEPFHL